MHKYQNLNCNSLELKSDEYTTGKSGNLPQLFICEPVSLRREQAGENKGGEPEVGAPLPLHNNIRLQQSWYFKVIKDGHTAAAGVRMDFEKFNHKA